MNEERDPRSELDRKGRDIDRLQRVINEGLVA